MSGKVLRRGQSLMKHKDIFSNRELFSNLGIDPRRPDMKESELRKGRQELEAQIEVERNSAAVALAKSRNPSSGIISSRAKKTFTALTNFLPRKMGHILVQITFLQRRLEYLLLERQRS